MNKEIFFSIITPAYCGGHFLRRLFENLLVVRTHYESFEWIIVDDHSPDQGETAKEMARIESLGLLQTQFVLSRQNSYNSKSIPVAAGIAKGSYSIIVDQDDLLEPKALVIFSKYIRRHERLPNFAGICARCVDLNGNPIGTPLPKNEIYASYLEIKHFYKIRGEMINCTKTQLLMRYFSSLEPGNTNGMAWTRMAKNFKYIFIQNTVRRYDTGNPNSVTNIRKTRYVATASRQYIEYLDTCITYWKTDPIEVFRMAVHAMRFSIHAHRLCKQKIPTSSFFAKSLLALALPIALLLCIRDSKKQIVSCN